MKAIIRIPTKKNRGSGESAASTYKRVHYNFLSVKVGASRLVGDRVIWIGGDLDRFGYVVRDPRLMAEALECGHEYLPGRRTRHLVLSGEPSSQDDQRAECFERLISSAPLLAKELGARRWIGIGHDDKGHPHLHIIISNFDEENGRRLDIRPSELSRLQDMEWTPFLDSGKGDRAKAQSKRAKEIEDTRKAASKKGDEDKASVIEKLRNFLHANKAPMMDKAALADWLMAAALPPAWEKRKLKTKNGKHRADPAIIIDGEGLKFSRFLASWRTKKLSLRARSEEKSLDLGRVGR